MMLGMLSKWFFLGLKTECNRFQRKEKSYRKISETF